MLPAIHSLVAGAARPRTSSPARISEDYPNSQPLAFDRHRRLHIRAIHDPSELDARKKISTGKSGLPENLPLPVVSEKWISVIFRIYRFQIWKFQKNLYKIG